MDGLGLVFAKPLQVDHAGHESLLEVLDPVRIVKISRQPSVGALHHAGTQAQITAL